MRTPENIVLNWRLCNYYVRNIADKQYPICSLSSSAGGLLHSPACNYIRQQLAETKFWLLLCFLWYLALC